MIMPLESDEVHFWTASELTDLRSLDPEALDPRERDRASRFLDETARSRFIAGRVLTRHILAGYLDLSPASIGFEVGPYGKLRLAELHARKGIHFNLSHAGDLVALGVAHFEIGVDVEEVSHGRFDQRLIGRVFNAEEQAAIRSSAHPLRSCFQLWVRKEACAKAIGLGLTSNLPGVDVSADECSVQSAEGHLITVRCSDLQLGARYTGAAASSFIAFRPRMLRWVA